MEKKKIWQPWLGLEETIQQNYPSCKKYTNQRTNQEAKSNSEGVGKIHRAQIREDFREITTPTLKHGGGSVTSNVTLLTLHSGLYGRVTKPSEMKKGMLQMKKKKISALMRAKLKFQPWHKAKKLTLLISVRSQPPHWSMVVGASHWTRHLASGLLKNCWTHLHKAALWLFPMPCQVIK